MATDIKQRYETHITLDAQDACVLENARNWTDKRGLKWTHIELDGGRTPSQPMITFRGSGTKQEQIERAKQLTEELADSEIKVVRVKVELELLYSQSEVESEITESSTSEYFEHHIKLLLSPKDNLEQLKQTACRFHARLSKNARRHRSDGAQERFVTQRVFGSNSTDSNTKLDSLMMALETTDAKILEIEREFVVFDSNLELDSGWMTNE